jgi:glycosyltransferase involved in cell wall biosynthesis
MPIYNQLTIVDAAPAILQTYPDCRFIFKSRSDYHSTKYEDQVRQRIKALGIETAVRIIAEIPYQKLPELYAVSDVIVSVPDVDGTPRSVLEAMACGAYPVVSDVEALHEWIEDRDNGLFVRSVEAGQIARAVLHALSSKENLEAAKLKNREIVETRASSDAWVAKMESLYQMAARRGSPRQKSAEG